MPPATGDEIIVDVEYRGICHSDTSMINNEWGTSRYPIVAGHEVVGRVAEIDVQVQ